VNTDDVHRIHRQIHDYPTLTRAQARDAARRRAEAIDRGKVNHAQPGPIRSTWSLFDGNHRMRAEPPSMDDERNAELDRRGAEEPELCDVCREGDGELPDDVVANYWDPKAQATRLAHVACADGMGWRLA
jgi:hypothetical protein